MEAMERVIIYLVKFHDTLKRNYPNADKRTVEEYLATCALFPPVFPELHSRKCVVEATALRIKGNSLFRTELYEEATKEYTNCIRRAPPYSEDTALGYANRSAALYHLKLWKECISDIDRALDLPYPNDMRDKIIKRKESAMNMLENEQENVQINNNGDVESLEQFKHGENPKLPQASRGIDIVHDSREGRKLISTMPFQTGDVLIVEKPYIMVPVLDANLSHCHHCLHETFSLIPCDDCNALYCSEKCRADAFENYHRIECQIQLAISVLPVVTEDFIFVLRCLMIFTEQGNNINQLLDDIEKYENNSDPARAGFTGGKFGENSKEAILSYLSGKQSKPIKGAMFRASYIVYLLRNYTKFFKSNADIPIVANLLVKLCRICETSYYPILSTKKPEPKGYVCFPLIGMVNHACINNTITYVNESGKMILRAIRCIRPGEQIMHNYRDLKFNTSGSLSRLGRIVECKRECIRCKKTFVYPTERVRHMKLDKKLRSTLERNCFDIDGLWKILNLIRGKNQHYSLQAQLIKMMLVDAYEGHGRIEMGLDNLQTLGIL